MLPALPGPLPCACSAPQLWPKFQAFLKAPAGSEEESKARGELLEQLKVSGCLSDSCLECKPCMGGGRRLYQGDCCITLAWFYSDASLTDPCMHPTLYRWWRQRSPTTTRTAAARCGSGHTNMRGAHVHRPCMCLRTAHGTHTYIMMLSTQGFCHSVLCCRR